MAVEGASHSSRTASSASNGSGAADSSSSKPSRRANASGSAPSGAGTIPGGDTLSRRESRQAARAGGANGAQTAPGGAGRGDSNAQPAAQARNAAGILGGGPLGGGGPFGGGGLFGGAAGNGASAGSANDAGGAQASQNPGSAQANSAQGATVLDQALQPLWEAAERGIKAKGDAMGSAPDVVNANRDNAYNALRDGTMAAPGAEQAFGAAKDGLWDLGKAAGQDPGQTSKQVNDILGAMTRGAGGGQPAQQTQGGAAQGGQSPDGATQGNAAQGGQTPAGAAQGGQVAGGAAQGGQAQDGAQNDRPQPDAAQGGQAQGGQAQSGSSGKKGVGIYANDAGGGGSSGFNGQSAAQLNPNWYYNWDTQPWGNTVPGKDGQPAPEFVPTMKPGAGSAANTALTGGSRHVLGFNEPDNKGMGGTGMSVQGALQQWPAGNPNVKIGSPGFANADSQFAQDFMRQADASGKQIDFLNYHHYPDMSGGKSVDQAVKETVDGVDRFHGQFGKNPLNGQDRKVWVTEYGLNGGTPAQQKEFAMKINKAFEANPNVERYSPFTNAHGSYGIGQMIDGNGAMTQVGKDYAATGGGR